MLFIGYFVIFTYSFILIFILGNLLNKKFKVEVSRKVIHILLFGIWIIIDMYMKNTIHQVIVPLIFFILNVFSYKFKLFKSIEREENNHFGTMYFALAILIILWAAYLNQRLYPYTGIAAICLTFGDGFAGFVGFKYGAKKIYNNKTIVGSISCFLFSFMGCLAYKLFYFPVIQWYDIVLISMMIMIVELIDFGLDNFSVPMVALIISYSLVTYPSSRLYLSIVCAIVVFFIVFLSKAIEYYGALVSMIIVFCYSYFGLEKGITFLLLCYGIIFLISLLKSHFYRKIPLECHTDGKQGKNMIQILANGGIGTFFIVLYGIFQDDNLLHVSLICIAGSFIDSISSDIGTLSLKRPYDFWKKKYVDRGVSGGVSLLGLVSAAVFTAGITCFIIFITNRVSIFYYMLTMSIIYSQTLIDTCLGSLIQLKLRCKV